MLYYDLGDIGWQDSHSTGVSQGRQLVFDRLEPTAEGCHGYFGSAG